MFLFHKYLRWVLHIVSVCIIHFHITVALNWYVLRRKLVSNFQHFLLVLIAVIHWGPWVIIVIVWALDFLFFIFWARTWYFYLILFFRLLLLGKACIIFCVNILLYIINSINFFKFATTKWRVLNNLALL